MCKNKRTQSKDKKKTKKTAVVVAKLRKLRTVPPEDPAFDLEVEYPRLDRSLTNRARV